MVIIYKNNIFQFPVRVHYKELWAVLKYFDSTQDLSSFETKNLFLQLILNKFDKYLQILLDK